MCECRHKMWGSAESRGYPVDIQMEVLGHAARLAVADLYAVPARRVAPDDCAVRDWEPLAGRCRKARPIRTPFGSTSECPAVPD